MKKLDKLIVRSYLGPFVMTFFIALFILLMQFLWKYIDDLVGKGLDTIIIVKLMVYASASLVPLALPLAILLSSIMTFGNMAENYELVACKAAGVSLRRVMMPLIVVSMLISLGAFYFSNVVLPFANLKMQSLLYDVRQQKPALSIKAGAFNNNIPGFSIKVDSKESDGVTLHGIMIYDHRDGLGNTKVTWAESGNMVMSADNNNLIITLQNGHGYEEVQNQKSAITHPFIRTSFAREEIHFDLSSFKMSRTNEELFKGSAQMLNIKQLQKAEDTLQMNLDNRKADFRKNLNNYYSFRKDPFTKNNVVLGFKNSDFILNFEKTERTRIIETALNQARSIKSYINSSKEEFDLTEKSIIKSKIEWHLKFTLSFSCLVLFFIGAPLGAIIRKGGLGLPVVFSTGFFVVYHILSITGKKFSASAVISVTSGMWLASIVFLPIGIFLTYKATSDSALFESDTYRRIIRLFIRKKKV